MSLWPDIDCEFAPYKKLIQETDTGNVEYKYKLSLSSSKDRIDKYITQLKFRLLEGHGKCLYEIGVLDDGQLIGLNYKDMMSSLECLEYMSKQLSCKTHIQRNYLVNNDIRRTSKPTKKSRNINDDIEPSTPLDIQTDVNTILDNLLDDDSDGDDRIDNNSLSLDTPLNLEKFKIKNKDYNSITEVLVYSQNELSGNTL